jgi:hypothetical protein
VPPGRSIIPWAYGTMDTHFWFQRTIKAYFDQKAEAEENRMETLYLQLDEPDRQYAREAVELVLREKREIARSQFSPYGHRMSSAYRQIFDRAMANGARQLDIEHLAQMVAIRQNLDQVDEQLQRAISALSEEDQELANLRCTTSLSAAAPGLFLTRRDAIATGELSVANFVQALVLKPSVKQKQVHPRHFGGRMKCACGNTPSPTCHVQSCKNCCPKQGCPRHS